MIYLFLVVPGLHCSARAFASCHEQGYSPLWSVGFLLRWRPLLWSTCSRCVSFRSLWALGMASVVAHGLSCLAACGNFPDQGLNPCPLHWQVDSYPLYHQRSRGGVLSCFYDEYYWLIPTHVCISSPLQL